VDSQLRKLQLTLELGIGAPPLRVPPLRLARVEHEPAFPLRDESVFGRFEPRLRNHCRKLPGLVSQRRHEEARIAPARPERREAPVACGLSPGLCPWKVLRLLRCRDSHFLAYDMRSPRFECMPRSSLIPRSSESRRSLPLKGDAMAFRPTQSGLGRTYFTARGDLRREGKGHGEEDIWKAWVGDHRLDGCRGDCGEPFDCGCLDDVASFCQRGGSGSCTGAR
jgi:hypothetical protein